MRFRHSVMDPEFVPAWAAGRAWVPAILCWRPYGKRSNCVRTNQIHRRRVLRRALGRRTKATLIYRRTGNVRAVQLLLGHTKIESTARYVGIEVDDAREMPEQVECNHWGRADTLCRHNRRPSALPSIASILPHCRNLALCAKSCHFRRHGPFPEAGELR
jgi:hypothetical protein